MARGGRGGKWCVYYIPCGVNSFLAYFPPEFLYTVALAVAVAGRKLELKRRGEHLLHSIAVEARGTMGSGKGADTGNT